MIPLQELRWHLWWAWMRSLWRAHDQLANSSLETWLWLRALNLLSYLIRKPRWGIASTQNDKTILRLTHNQCVPFRSFRLSKTTPPSQAC